MSTKNNQENPIENIEAPVDKELVGVDEKLVREIIEIISEQLGIDAKDVTPEKAFGEDLAADSLDQTELIMALEEKYSLEISEQEAEQLKKVKDVIRYVNTKIGQTNSIG